MAWSLEGERHDDPEWEPERAGPEYHLNKRAPSRCLMCGMAQRLTVDDDGPLMVCTNRRCMYTERV